MNVPQLLPHYSVAPDTYVIPETLPVPGFGLLPVNSYLVLGAEPLLVDTGLAALGADFVAELRKLVAPEDLAWIWLTHTDPDHMGALAPLLELAPRARLVTTYLGMGKLTMSLPIAPQRIQLLNPGQQLELADRTLSAFRPPCFDAPETTGLTDGKTGALFSSDAFGCVLSQAYAWAGDIPDTELAQGMRLWANVDAPWLRDLAPQVLQRNLRPLAELAPDLVLSSHLPPARGMHAKLLAELDAARTAPPFVGPDQQALRALLAA